MAEFLTIKSPAEGLYKEKASKFLAYAFPVQTEEQVKEHLAEMKKLHPKANHVCYAFRLGAMGAHYRASDAGEPSGTAGAPILGQLRSHNLTDILLVVVRYFGGTKLGVSGLIQAYKESAAEALKNAEIVKDFEKCRVTISIAYQYLNSLMNFVKTNNVSILEQDSEADKCIITLSFRSEEKEGIEEQLKKLKTRYFTQ
jgi:uncharacterized YigZ family protein